MVVNINFHNNTPIYSHNKAFKYATYAFMVKGLRHPSKFPYKQVINKTTTTLTCVFIAKNL